jgi:tRNA (guanine-N7-)-methyltransferase
MQTAQKYLRIWRGRDLHRDPQLFPSLTSLELFGNDRPLEIDLGCGTGVLACSRARKFPGVNFLGIDQSQKPLFCAIAEAVTLGIENVKFIRGDFEAMMTLFRPQTIGAAFYLFPKPPRDYHLERANGRRRQFLRTVHDALSLGGRFYFATDSSLFFECLSGIIRNDLRYTALEVANIDFEMSTKYRQIWEQRGRSVNSLVIEKGL